MEMGRSCLLPSTLPLASPPLRLLLLFPFLSSYAVVVLVRSFHEKKLGSWVGFLTSESVESTPGAVQWALMLVQVK